MSPLDLKDSHTPAPHSAACWVIQKGEQQSKAKRLALDALEVMPGNTFGCSQDFWHSPRLCIPMLRDTLC